MAIQKGPKDLVINAAAGDTSGGLAKVSSDGTLTGDGTSTNKLKVAVPFTTALRTKLNGIATGAQVNPSDAQIKTAYERNADTNALTDSALAAIGRIPATGGDANQVWKKGPNNEAAAWRADAVGEAGGGLTTVNSDATLTGAGTSTSPLKVATPFTATLKTKLDGIEESADVNPTAAEIKTSYESNADTNALTDTEKTKVGRLPDHAVASASPTSIKLWVGAESGAPQTRDSTTLYIFTS